MRLPPPNLSDPGERAAYRKELGKIAVKTRMSGLALASMGIVLALYTRFKLDTPAMRVASIVIIAAGMGLMIFGIMRRTLYHSQRMRAVD